MSRFFLASCVTLLLLPGVMAQNPFDVEAGDAEAGDLTGERVSTQPTQLPRVWTTAEIEAVLEEPIKASLVYQDQPLCEIIAVLQADLDFPILFDHSALSEFAISPESEVTLNLSNVTLRTAFELMFRQPGLEDLTTMVDSGVLLITTQERAAETLAVKMYRVDDFPFDVLVDHAEGTDRSFANLLQVIVSCVEYDSWQQNGTGEGQLHLMRPGILVVTQTQRVHWQIEKFLQDLRAVRDEIEGASEHISSK